MYVVDMSFILLGMILLLLYNAVMTVIFVNQRYNFTTNKSFRNTAIFLISVIAQIILAPFGMGIWTLLYFITISSLVIAEKIAKERLKNSNQQTTP